MKGNCKSVTQQRGFTIMQMVITLAIITVVSTFGVLGIKNARAEFRLHSSARLFASYVEKARADSIRRHAAPGSESSVEIFGAGTTTYAVTMDYGSGAIETRNFELESGLEFGTEALKVTFDWRGRITEPCAETTGCVFQVSSIYLKYAVPVDVSGSGDITVGEQHFPDQMIPPVEISQVNSNTDVNTGDVVPTPTPTVEESPTPVEEPTPPTEEATPTPSPSPTATPHGNGNGNGTDTNNGNGHPSPTPTPAASPTPTPDSSPIPQCVSTISPPSISLSQTDPTKLTKTATFTMTNATGVRTISASLLGSGNSLILDVGLQRIDGSGSSVIKVTSKNGAGNRGTFSVEVSASPACGAAQKLTVFVSN